MSSFVDELDRDIFPFISYPGYNFSYPAESVLTFPETLYNEIRDVSQKLFAIFVKTARNFMACSDEWKREMEIPEKILPYLSVKNPLDLPTWLSRFDYVFDTDGKLHMVELNADTPCALIEAYYANGVATKHHGVPNPNEGEYEKLQAFMNGIAERVFTGQEKGTFLFTCFHDYIEDYGTTQFLKNATTSPLCDCRFETLYDMAVHDGYFECPDKTRPRIVYRLHPMELFVEEKSPEGYDLGLLSLEGYKDGKFIMMNPPEAIVMQSKAFLALIRALACETKFYSEEEKNLIAQYIAPSFFAGDCTFDTKYIVKPVWGREGRGITIQNAKGVVYRKEIDHEPVQRDSEKFVYQQYIEQKQFLVQTEYAKNISGYVTISCFMLGDQSSAVYARFGYEPVLGTEAFWVPLGIAE